MTHKARWFVITIFVAALLWNNAPSLSAARSIPQRAVDRTLRSRPSKLVTLGQGRLGGATWTVSASPSQPGPKATERGCISAVAMSGREQDAKNIACGSLRGPPRGANNSPLYALASGKEPTKPGGHIFNGTIIGMTFAPSVMKVSLQLGSQPTLTQSTKAISERQAASLHLKRFRYIALALGSKVCVAHVAGFDRGGDALFSATTGRCPAPELVEPTKLTIGPPSVELLEPPNLTGGDTELRGTINPGGLVTSYGFEWGNTESYGQRVPAPDGSVGPGHTSTPVDASISGLKGETTYYDRIFAENGKGAAEAKSNFTTPNWRPSVVAEPATEVLKRTAILHASIDPQGFGTHYRFEWGTTRSYGRKFESPTELTGASSEPVSQEITSLEAETTYYFRIVAENSEGVSEGKGALATTPGRSSRRPGTWTIQSTPNPEEGLEKVSKLAAVSCTTLSACTAVGEYRNSSGVPQGLAERLEGSAWKIQATPERSEPVSLTGVSCLTANNCTAAGAALSGTTDLPIVEHWSGGSEWQSQQVPNRGLGGRFTGISCTGPNECTAVGYFQSSATEVETLAERWNGENWETQSTPNIVGAKLTELTGVSCNDFLILGLFERECIASGYAKNLLGNYEAIGERWDGTKWEILSAVREQTNASVLTGISCAPSTECVAVGYLENASGVDVALADRWTGFFGRMWEPETPANPTGAKLTKLDGVSCNDTRALECMAGGEYEDSSGVYHSLADQWYSEEGWATLATPDPASAIASSLAGVSCSGGGECIASGYYENGPGTDVTLAQEFG